MRRSWVEEEDEGNMKEAVAEEKGEEKRKDVKEEDKRRR